MLPLLPQQIHHAMDKIQNITVDITPPNIVGVMVHVPIGGTNALIKNLDILTMPPFKIERVEVPHMFEILDIQDR